MSLSQLKVEETTRRQTYHIMDREHRGELPGYLGYDSQIQWEGGGKSSVR